MGQVMSCRTTYEHGLFCAVQFGDLKTVETLIQTDPTIIHQSTLYNRHSALHIAAANDQIEVTFLVSFFHLSISRFIGSLCFMGFVYFVITDRVYAFREICEP